MFLAGLRSNQGLAGLPEILRLWGNSARVILTFLKATYSLVNLVLHLLELDLLLQRKSPDRLSFLSELCPEVLTVS